jgi:hypothetical protein
MDLKVSIEKLEQSPEYKRIKSKGIFFSYALIMIENNQQSPIQLGYYKRSTDRIITFIVEENSVTVQNEEEIFKKPDVKVIPINTKKIKLPHKEILKIAKTFQKQKYPQEMISKTIAILQNLSDYGNIWNITFIMHSFKTLNIKISAENGKILHHNLQSIMDFVKK